MNCPACTSRTKVLDNRVDFGYDNDNTYRMRQCRVCRHKFVTEERIAVFKYLSKRRDAAKERHKQYYTGKLCKHGHMSPRYTKSAKCVQCNIDGAYRNAATVKRFEKLANRC